MQKAILVALIALAVVVSAEYKTKWVSEIKIQAVGNVTLRADAFIPEPTTAGQVFPVIVFPNSWGCPQIEYITRALHLAESGYVTIEYETRGWYTSGGTIDVAGPLDRQDGSTVIDYVAAHAKEWNANMSSLGFMGISYGAGISLEMAGFDTRVKTSAALSGWNNLTDMFDGNQSPNYHEVESLIHVAHDKNHGRISPGMLKVAQELKEHVNMSDVYAFGNARSPQVYLNLYNQRKTPLFMSSNFMDRLFRPQYMVEFYNQLTSPKFLLMNQGMHAEPEAVGILDRHNYIWTKAKMWMDHWLKGIDTGITSEAPVQMQLGASLASKTYLQFKDTNTAANNGGNTRYFFGHRDAHKYGSLRTVPQPDYYDRIIYNTAPGLTSGKSEDKTESIGIPFNTNFSAASPQASIVYTSEVFNASKILCGTPKVKLHLGPTEYNWQVYGFLYDIDTHTHSDVGSLLSESFFTNWAPSTNRVAEFALHSVCRTVEAGHQLAVGFVLYNSIYLPASTTVQVSLEYGPESYVDIPFVASQ